jgi:hypothetical protein
MADVLGALETEYLRLKNEIQITEDTFFVMLSEKYIDRHCDDLGIPASGDGVALKRSRILARLRGLATMTPANLENVVNAYVYGSVRIEEFPGQYLFKIKFINKKGTPENLDEIMSVVELVKPAHLAVEYVFTYRVWQEVRAEFLTWGGLAPYTWDFVRTFENIRDYLNVVGGKVYFCPEGAGNARLEFIDNRAYAVLAEQRYIHITSEGRAFFCVHNDGNAELIFENNRAFGRKEEMIPYA